MTDQPRTPAEPWPLSDAVRAKARSYVEEGRVTELGPGAWSVQGTAERPYIIQTDGRPGRRYLTHIVCTCDHGRHTSGRARCSHAAAVALVLTTSTRRTP